MDVAAWEGTAEAFLRAVGIDVEHRDPRLIAVAYELELVPSLDRSGRASCMRGERVRVPVLAHPQRQAGVIAHELGHVALERHGEEQSEEGAGYVGAAILVPRRALLRALTCHGPDLPVLCTLFAHASPELLARRVADVGEYECAVVDGRRVRRHAALVPSAPLDALTPLEAVLVREARARGVAEIEGTRAWHLESAGHHRTILLSA